MDPNCTVGFPDGIGCGLGGGEWTVISELLKEFSEKVKQDVYIVHKLKPYVRSD